MPELTARSDLYGEGTANVDLDEDKLKEVCCRCWSSFSSCRRKVSDAFSPCDVNISSPTECFLLLLFSYAAYVVVVVAVVVVGVN